MKENIIRQSVRLFEEKGFSETSIQDIVEAIGVTKGTFYYYFSSKEQLLMDIHTAYIDRLLQRQRAIIEAPGSSREKIVRTVELLIMDIEEYGPSARVFFREMRHLKPVNAETIKGRREQFRLDIERLLEEGKSAGEFRGELNSSMTAFALLGVANWSYQWFNPKGEIAPAKLAALYSDLIFNGIAKEREDEAHGTGD